MVIVVMGPADTGRSAVGQALAERLGWAFLHADRHQLERLRTVVAGAVDRREPLVVTCSVLEDGERRTVSEGLRQVRFVSLKTPPAGAPGDDALTLDGAADVDTIVGHIRLAFGV